MEYNYKVYAHINKTNGKIYVGITCRSLKQRWGNGKGYNGHFGRAIDKYGWDGFEHELIASGLTEKEAKRFEILLIDKLKTQDEEYGYNLTKGGDGTCGYHHSKESRNKMSETKRKKYKIHNPLYGVKRPHAANNAPRKAVWQFDFDGNFIKEYSSIREVARDTEYTNRGTIAKCCQGISQHAYNYLWVYKGDYAMLNKLIDNVRNSKRIFGLYVKVNQYDLNYNLIVAHASIRDACRYNKKSEYYIRKRLEEGYRGKKDIYIFEYANEKGDEVNDS